MFDALACLGGRQLHNVKGKLATIGCALALLPGAPVMAQNCTPDDISLIEQAGIDSFQKDHGPCDTIVQYLNVRESGGTNTIVNLDGLSGLTHIGTDRMTGSRLSISENSILTSISGLSNIVFAGEINLDNNDSLTSLTGLSGFPADSAALGTLRLNSMDGLTSLAGLPAALLGMGGLDIGSCDNLTSLAGVPAMSIIFSLQINDNEKLTSLSALSAIGQVGGIFMEEMFPGTIEINSNIMLTDLSGVPPATALDRLSISGNGTQIASSQSGSRTQGAAWNLDFLSELEYIGDHLIITSNPLLADCSALKKVLDDVDDGEPGPGPGEDGIPDVQGTIWIENNQAGCNSIEEILNSSNADDDVFEDGFEEE